MSAVRSSSKNSSDNNKERCDHQASFTSYSIANEPYEDLAKYLA